jgi:methionyl-tRNA formyltransferase
MNATTRIVFMGTPDFATPCLRALVEQSEASQWEVVAVVTQPDRRAGRGKKLVASPVKQMALDYGLPVLQPERLRKRPDAVEELRALAADLFVVAAYGLILPVDVLEIPQFGCINVHASLLPAYRGASPITAAILDGSDETGVTIMLMDEGMDTGPVLHQAAQPIRADDTTATLSARLAEQGAAELVELLPRWLGGEIAPIDQDELPGEPSACRLIKKQDGLIDWEQPAVYIERMTRAYAPWPSAFTRWQGQNFKILQAAVVEGQAGPGAVVMTDQGPAVGTGEGLLLLKMVQPAGKRAMDIRSFLNGAPDFVGGRVGG